MKRIFCALLVATLPFVGALAQSPKEKAAKVTLVYQHELPNVPGKSFRQSFSELPEAPRGVRRGHERDGPDDPIRELRFNTFRAEILRRALRKVTNHEFDRERRAGVSCEVGD